MTLTILTPAAQAQTFTVLHSFTGGADGANPAAGLTIDHSGTLYGTAEQGGNTPSNCGTTRGCGTVFRVQYRGSGWILTPIYKFSGTDGLSPLGRLTFGPDGSLYGTTYAGQGDDCSCGNVFNLRPSATAPRTSLQPWVETVIHQFSPMENEGVGPMGDLIFDPAGNLYGTTITGGTYNQCSGGIGCGTVYELTPSAQGWTETLVYALTEADFYPVSGVIRDRSGNLYGTAVEGNFNNGAVFQLSPSGPGWIENTLYSFSGSSNGESPYAGLIFDQVGNLYGATLQGGSGGGGTVFQLTPSGSSWTQSTLYSFPGTAGSGPYATLLMDSGGNLYGTTKGAGAYGKGSVFKLTPDNGAWTLSTLHDFTGGADGATPESSLVMDATGNLYGTTYAGGSTGSHCDSSTNYECGVVFEITP
ncbi:MAG: choice-of-anchor tandem repeat GloVer-containing protein [Candidatus Korobacteraceae bacterium]